MGELLGSRRTERSAQRGLQVVARCAGDTRRAICALPAFANSPDLGDAHGMLAVLRQT